MMDSLSPIDRELAKLDSKLFITRKSQDKALRKASRTRAQLKNMSRANVDLDLPITKTRSSFPIHKQGQNENEEKISKSVQSKPVKLPSSSIKPSESEDHESGLIWPSSLEKDKEPPVPTRLFRPLPPIRKLVRPKPISKNILVGRVRYLKGSRGFTKRKNTGRLR